MACNNCEGNATLGSTQGNLVAWVQPGGAGPNNDVFYAMAEGGTYPAIKITGVSRKRRGTTTPIFRRSGLNPRKSVRVGETTTQPAANTATLQFAEGRCGGYLPNELIRCKLDVYQQHICCGDGGDFEDGWSRIDVLAGFDPESDDYSDQTSFAAEEDTALTITHPGEFREKLTIYPLAVAEIAAAAGLDVGAQVADVVYANKESCGDACGGNQGCQDQWYAVTNEGKVIYKKNALAAVAINTIAGYTASERAVIGILGNKLLVGYRDTAGAGSGGFWWAELDSDGDPGTWTAVELAAGFNPARFLVYGNKILLGGWAQAGVQARIYEIDKSMAGTLLFSSGANATGLRDMIECGGRIVAVGESGTVLVSSCAGVFGAAGSAPTSGSLFSISARSLNEWWVSDHTNGEIWYTLDAGDNWIEKVFDFSGAADQHPYQVIWANPNVGYVLLEDATAAALNAKIYVTWNGGESWVNGAATNSRIATHPTGTLFRRMAIPCCSSPVEQSNSFLLAGIATNDEAVPAVTTGGLWQATIQQCQ